MTRPAPLYVAHGLRAGAIIAASIDEYASRGVEPRFVAAALLRAAADRENADRVLPVALAA